MKSTVAIFVTFFLLSTFSASAAQRKAAPREEDKSAVKTLKIGEASKPETRPSQAATPKSITAERGTADSSKPAPSKVEPIKPAVKVDPDVVVSIKVQGTQSAVARILSAKGSDLDRLPVVAGLTGEAMEKYKQKLTERNEGYDKWLKSARGQEFAAAQRKLGVIRRPRATNGRQTDAEKEFVSLRAEQVSVRKELRRELNSCFDLAQMKLWAGSMLYEETITRFASAKLTDEQKQQACALCLTLAVINTTESDVQRDPYLEPTDTMKDTAAAMIRMIVLAPEQ